MLRFTLLISLILCSGCAITSQIVVRGQHDGIQYEANVAANRNF